MLWVRKYLQFYAENTWCYILFASNRTFIHGSARYGPCSEKTDLCVLAESKDRFLVTRSIIIMWFGSLKNFFPDHSFIYIHEYLMSQPFCMPNPLYSIIYKDIISVEISAL